jgi:hypothetical protein
VTGSGVTIWKPGQRLLAPVPAPTFQYVDDLAGALPFISAIIHVVGGDPVENRLIAELAITALELPPAAVRSTDPDGAMERLKLTATSSLNVVEGTADAAMVDFLSLPASCSGIALVQHGPADEALFEKRWKFYTEMGRASGSAIVVIRPITPDFARQKASGYCANAVLAAGGGCIVFKRRVDSLYGDGYESWQKVEDVLKERKGYSSRSWRPIDPTILFDAAELGLRLDHVHGIGIGSLTPTAATQARFPLARCRIVSLWLADHVSVIRQALHDVLASVYGVQKS